MSQEQGLRSARDINRQWQSLAERRRQYLLGLYESDRWQRYYTEAQMRAQMHEVERAIETWSALTGLPPQDGDHDSNSQMSQAAE